MIVNKEKVVINCKRQLIEMNKGKDKLEIRFEENEATIGEEFESMSLKIENENEGLGYLYELYHIKSLIDDEKTEVEFHELIDDIEELNEEQKPKSTTILERNREVFANKPGRVKKFQYKVEVLPHEPLSVKTYSVPIYKKQAVQKEINKMMDWDVIERSTSEYNNPLIIVNKRDGDIRIVIDARTLNKIVKQEVDQPENLEEMLQKFHNVKFLTNLDSWLLANRAARGIEK